VKTYYFFTDTLQYISCLQKSFPSSNPYVSRKRLLGLYFQRAARFRDIFGGLLDNTSVLYGYRYGLNYDIINFTTAEELWSFAHGKLRLGGLTVYQTFERQVAAGEASEERIQNCRMILFP
jgi:hypothetical protein